MNKREKHKQDVETAIVLLARFGYLRASDIALVVYADTTSALRMSQRLLATMHKKGLVMRAQEHKCTEAHYALSEAGAREALRLTGESYKTGKDLLRATSGHRDAANRVCIEALASGAGDVVSEREVYTTGDYKLAGKMPDGLIVRKERTAAGDIIDAFTWIEVEHSYRQAAGLEKLAGFVVELFGKEGRVRYCGGVVDRLMLVIADDSAETIVDRLKRAIDKLRGRGAGNKIVMQHIDVKSLLKYRA